MRALLSTAAAVALSSLASAQIGSYSQDFEGLVQADGGALAADGWLVFGNVFTNDFSTYLYGYGTFPAPNGGPGFCGIDVGQGGVDQGAQQLVVYNDYNNGDHGNGFQIEANVFQERVVDAGDAGKTFTFSFDAKLGNLVPPTTAIAFIKLLDPNAGFSLSAFETVDMTTLPTTWGSFSLSTTIDASQVGHIFQIGFASTTTNFVPSGIFYDNINMAEDAGCTSNDDCACAEAISGSGLFAFDNSAATTDGLGDPLCYDFGSSQIDNDVWFAWTADDSCDVTISTCGLTSVDTRLAIFDGADCATSAVVACNDDTCGTQSEVTASVVSGTTYLIRLGSFPGASGGTGMFDISECSSGPANDDCADATPISGTGTFAFDNSAATTDGLGDPLCYDFGTSQIDFDVWYEWTADETCDYTFSTCDLTSVDTRMSLLDACGGTVLACNDDNCTVGLQSEFSITGLAAGTYLIRVGSFPGASGGIGEFSIADANCVGAPGDDCGDAISTLR